MSCPWIAEVCEPFPTVWREGVAPGGRVAACQSADPARWEPYHLSRESAESHGTGCAFVVSPKRLSAQDTPPRSSDVWSKVWRRGKLRRKPVSVPGLRRISGQLSPKRLSTRSALDCGGHDGRASAPRGANPGCP